MPNDTSPSFSSSASHELVVKATGRRIRAGSLDECSRQFAAMNFASDYTIRLVGAAPSGTVTRTVAATSVSAVAQERIARHESALSAMGIALDPPVYAAGTTVNATGEGNFRTSRLAWEQLPLAEEAAADIAATVRAERRHDIRARPNQITMAFGGSLVVDGEPIALTRNGLRGLLSYYSDEFPRAFALLSVLPPSIRADVVNEQLSAAVKSRRDAVTLRCRMTDAGVQAFAAVSPSYGAFNADKVMDAAAGALRGSGMRAEAVYNPATTDVSLTALYHADQVVDLAAGDVFKVGATVTTHDGGGGAIIVDAAAWRNRCLNLIIIGKGAANQARIVHRGTVSGVGEDIRRAVAKVPAMFAGFAAEWNVLRATPYAGVKVGGKPLDADPRKALAQLAAAGEITTATARDATVEALISGYRHEPGKSVADLVNAVTRSAWDGLLDQIKRDQYERAAGALVPVLARAAAAEA